MKGLELSKKFYYEYGKNLIEKQFKDVCSKIAVGLVGEGSECFGFDDEISQDHDFEPGFCLWLTRNDYDDFGFKLEKMYSMLPKQFCSFSRLNFSPSGQKRHGVMIIEDYYERFLGYPDLPDRVEDWFYIPTESLACACNGEVFCDNLGEFSRIRNTLLKGFPEDVKLKKMSSHIALMFQAGLYNYERMIKRRDSGAAQLCIFEFVKHSISLIYLLNNTYEPFYKWKYKMMRRLTLLSNLEPSLIALTELGNSDIESRAKLESIECICDEFVKEFKNQELITSNTWKFDECAFEIQNKIKNCNIRNMHIMDGTY